MTASAPGFAHLLEEGKDGASIFVFISLTKQNLSPKTSSADVVAADHVVTYQGKKVTVQATRDYNQI